MYVSWQVFQVLKFALHHHIEFEVLAFNQPTYFENETAFLWKQWYLRTKLMVSLPRSLYLLTYLLTYSTDQSLYWEANRFSASQEISRILWNLKVYYCRLKCLPPVPLSWPSSIQSIPPNSTSWRYILILSSHLCLGLSSGLSPSGFPTRTLYMPLLSSIHTTWPTHLIFLDFITQTILGEEYKSLSSSLCSFLHSPVTSSLLGPNIILNTLFSNTLSPRSSLNVSDQVSHPYDTTSNIIVLYIWTLILLMWRIWWAPNNASK